MKLSEDAKQLEYATKRHCSLQERTGWLFDEQGATQLLLKVNDDLRNAEEEVHKSGMNFLLSPRAKRGD